MKTEDRGVSLNVTTTDPFETDHLVLGTFKRWSSSAVECYMRKAQCDGCYYQAFFADRPYGCKMDLAVEQLIETIGEPSPSLVAKYS